MGIRRSLVWRSYHSADLLDTGHTVVEAMGRMVSTHRSDPDGASLRLPCPRRTPGEAVASADGKGGASLAADGN